MQCVVSVQTVTSYSIRIQYIATITSTGETSFSVCTCLSTIVSVVSTFINICIKENNTNVNSEIQLHTSAYFSL